MQNGVRVTSTSRTGSQKPIATPTRGGLLQKHTGEDGLAVSGWPSETRVAEPSVSGNMQLQQMSVIGFMNLPWQVGPAAAGVARPAKPASPDRLTNAAKVATSRITHVTVYPDSALVTREVEVPAGGA